MQLVIFLMAYTTLPIHLSDANGLFQRNSVYNMSIKFKIGVVMVKCGIFAIGHTMIGHNDYIYLSNDEKWI